MPSRPLIALGSLIAMLVVGGCSGDERERYGVVRGEVESVRSMQWKAAYRGESLRVRGQLELEGNELVGKNVSMQCRRRGPAAGKLTSGAEGTVAKSGKVTLRVTDAAFAQSFWNEGGVCTIAVGVRSLPVRVIFPSA